MDYSYQLRIIEAYIEQEKGVTVSINDPTTTKQRTLMARAFAKADLMLIR